jgi:copper homeostasis protein
MRMKLEICVDSVASAMAAEQGGADRIELCSALSEDGITPSLGMIRTVRAKVRLSVNVIVRPRGGDFVYDDDEFAVMREDIRQARTAGCDGLVLGLLTADGHIDCARTRQLIEEAAPLPVTFHRAFDMVVDPFSALEEVIACGAKRILTSGGCPTALEGVEQLARLQKQAAGRVRLMAGGGVRQHNLGKIVAQTGITELHTSLAKSLPSQAAETAGKAIPVLPRKLVDAEAVRRFKEEFVRVVEHGNAVLVQ